MKTSAQFSYHYDRQEVPIVKVRKVWEQIPEDDMYALNIGPARIFVTREQLAGMVSDIMEQSADLGLDFVGTIIKALNNTPARV